MAAAPIKTPIMQSLIDRVSGAVRFAVSGKFPDAWFGPGDTVAPVAPKDEVEGRRFDFLTGINTRYTPRTDEAVSFAQMRALADACDILRLVIETRKDQMAKLRWKIVPIDPKAQPDSRCDAITNFLRFPDAEHSWDDWLRMVLEDLLVLDAPAIYIRRNLGGKIIAVEPIDGSLIKPVLNEFGRRPEPPLPAYQQVLKGTPAVDYSAQELLYRPRNIRTHKAYGYSPVEQIITTINIALRRAANQLSYYTEGNTPNLIFGAPESWNPDQIQRFQNWWDLLNASDSKHKAKFVPGGVKPFDTKDQVLKDEFDEWLARIVCFAFSISPTPFIKQQNRATAETAHAAALSEGLAPNMNWVASTINLMIQRPDLFGAADLHFVWDEEEATDPQVQSQIEDVAIRNGSMLIDEARAKRGQEPLEAGLGSVPLIVTGSGAVLLKDIINPPPPPPPPPMLQAPTPISASDATNDGSTDDAAGKTLQATLKKKSY